MLPNSFQWAHFDYKIYVNHIFLRLILVDPITEFWSMYRDRLTLVFLHFLKSNDISNADLFCSWLYSQLTYIACNRSIAFFYKRSNHYLFHLFELIWAKLKIVFFEFYWLTKSTIYIIWNDSSTRILVLQFSFTFLSSKIKPNENIQIENVISPK